MDKNFYKILVVLPCYNEAETIQIAIERTLGVQENIDVLVVDDSSPDGTAQKVKELMKETQRLFLIERPGKLGLGTAYIAGFKWGLERNYDLFFEMDADLSHDPSAIPAFINRIDEGYDVVIGSRYKKGTISVVGWDFKRLLLSKMGNFYVRLFTPLKDFTDTTSGFRCYNRKALEAIDLDKIRANGYAFQVEILYRCYISGLRITEITIIFYERNGGSSKMNKKIIAEAMVLPFKLLLENYIT